ncbi:hypothetical protein J2Y69_003061 [Microbacterium resistens]|uniref:Minor tail protein n=1 Tax=Microbacterium resistens TaxID=156977 RepID=A0ABU1SFT8_9MICO|nr:hypothetical protein [Microbacterium resistens]MDR6868445.1 hypothetical protein [Microbacterium resistens]
MAEIVAHVCDGITGDRIDTVPIADFPHSRLMSARGDASAAVRLNGTFSKPALKELLTPWRNLMVLERDGVVQYGGYIIGRPYQLGASEVTVRLGDLWALMARRIMTGRTAQNVVLWNETVTGTLPQIAAWHMSESWNRNVLPSPKFPFSIGPFPDTKAITRKYFGYTMQTVGDVLSSLMSEGLDIYFRPQWAGDGRFEWHMLGGEAWSSQVVREFNVSAKKSPVISFSEDVNAGGQTNNADRVGEGSEIKLLVNSHENRASPLPLLERITMSKSVNDIDQLHALAVQDIATFGKPVTEWSFVVDADLPADVGDIADLTFDGDKWMDDGTFPHRIVRVNAGIGRTKTIAVQPDGRA